MNPEISDPWTADQLLRLRQLHGSKANEDVGERIGRTAAEVAAKAAELALEKNKRVFKGIPMPHWTKLEIMKLRTLHPMASNVEIAKILGRSARSVASKAHHLGIRKDPKRLSRMGREVVQLRRNRKPKSPF